jgi:hypothetical protein
LRRIVLVAGLAGATGGAAGIAALPVAANWRIAALLLWALICGRDLWLIAIAYRSCVRIRIEHTGNMLVYAGDNCCSRATLGAGSVVLRDFAWLRFRAENGRRHVELLRRRTSQNKDWRRLQVIWRHLGAGA